MLIFIYAHTPKHIFIGWHKNQVRSWVESHLIHLFFSILFKLDRIKIYIFYAMAALHCHYINNHRNHTEYWMNHMYKNDFLHLLDWFWHTIYTHRAVATACVYTRSSYTMLLSCACVRMVRKWQFIYHHMGVRICGARSQSSFVCCCFLFCLFDFRSRLGRYISHWDISYCLNNWDFSPNFACRIKFIK